MSTEKKFSTEYETLKQDDTDICFVGIPFVLHNKNTQNYVSSCFAGKKVSGISFCFRKATKKGFFAKILRPGPFNIGRVVRA
jgi:hypothetical protein